MMSVGNDEEIEEERRLAYVAITRAKRKLYVLNARERMMFGKTRYNPPSPFLDEIPAQYIIDETEAKREPVTIYRSNYKPELSSELTTPVTRTTPIKKAVHEVFNEGERVSHATFGLGTVLSVKKMGADTLYEVMFDSVGTKKLMATFAKLKKA